MMNKINVLAVFPPSVSMLPTRACTEAAEEVGHYIHAECTHSRVQPAPPPDPLTFEDHRLCSGRQKNAAGSDVSAFLR